MICLYRQYLNYDPWVWVCRACVQGMCTWVWWEWKWATEMTVDANAQVSAIYAHIYSAEIFGQNTYLWKVYVYVWKTHYMWADRMCICRHRASMWIRPPNSWQLGAHTQGTYFELYVFSLSWVYYDLGQTASRYLGITRCRMVTMYVSQGCH